GRRAAETLERQLSVSGNYGQEVIEIMRHAARQTAERLHLAGLCELLFQHAAFGDVDSDSTDQRNLAILDDRKFVNEPGMLPVGLGHRFDKFDGMPRRDDGRIVRTIALRVFRRPYFFVDLSDDVFRTL